MACSFGFGVTFVYELVMGLESCLKRFTSTHFDISFLLPLIDAL